MTVEADLSEYALVAQCPEDNAFGARHVKGLQALFLDPCEDLPGRLLGSFAFENNDNFRKIPLIEGMKKPAGSRRVLEEMQRKARGLSCYPFVTRATSVAGDQRHHQVVAERM